MNRDFSIRYGEKEALAGELFAAELTKRSITVYENITAFVLQTDASLEEEQYTVSLSGEEVRLCSGSVRGLIFACGRVLRKTEVTKETKDGRLCILRREVFGCFRPEKSVRGHQLGYRACTNTYDAWDEQAYTRYMTELMLFGANTVEFIPDQPENELMKKSSREMLIFCVQQAKKLGLLTSLWYPNDSLPEEESAQKRRDILSDIPSLDVLFIPGSDPGDYPAGELMRRVKTIAEKIHEVCGCQIFVSAQAPHNSPTWGDEFIEELKDCPSFLDGVIMGPNHAMPLPELRKRVPACYPIRMYNDITHNVRCEYPVHYSEDDWHFSCAVINGRESINPRPVEFAHLHKEVNPYVFGSCSYSEGINDDFNKCLWSALDFDESTDIVEIAEDYARLFFPGVDCRKAAEGILGLEKNWIGDSLYNEQIDRTYALFVSLRKETPSLDENWRFNTLLFRAVCDKLSRMRRCFETELIEKARQLLKEDKLSCAMKALETPFSSDYLLLREEAERLGSLLFTQIGLQLDMARYHASGWERGATLESIDLPLTDRAYLLTKLRECESACEAMKYFTRNEVEDDEVYYSVALHGKKGLNAEQPLEVYLNFRGDSPRDNDGSRPVCLLNIFDSWVLFAHFTGLSDADYILKVTYSDQPDRTVEHHAVKVNGHVLYDGAGYGGKRDGEYEKAFLPDAFVAVDYEIPAEYIRNGEVFIEISEPTVGFEMSELRIVHPTKQGA